MRKPWLLLCCAISFASTARAEDVAEAKRYFDAGAQAFAVGQFAAAAQAFERSYALAARPGTLFSLGQAERRQYVVDRDPEHLRRALDVFRRYVQGVEQGQRRLEAVEAIAELEPMLARTPSSETRSAPTATRLMVTARIGARVRVDGEAGSDAPLIRDANPGRHHVLVEAEGFFPENRDVIVEPGALVVVDVTLRERPGTIAIVTGGAATVYVDGEARAESPNPTLVVPSGKHEITVARNGAEPWRTLVDVERGKAISLRPALVRSRQRLVAWTALGAAGAAVVAGGAFGLVSLQAESEARDFLGRRETESVTTGDIDAYRDAAERRDAWRTAAVASALSGVGLAVLGAALYAFDRPSVRRDVVVGQGGVGLRF